jgi:hypothetical protein
MAHHMYDDGWDEYLDRIFRHVDNLILMQTVCFYEFQHLLPHASDALRHIDIRMMDSEELKTLFRHARKLNSLVMGLLESVSLSVFNEFAPESLTALCITSPVDNLPSTR